MRFRDLDGDGRCELIVSNDKEQAIFHLAGPEKALDETALHAAGGHGNRERRRAGQRAALRGHR